MAARRTRLTLLLALWCLVLFFTGLWATPLIDRDEGEYGASVAEMVRSGDYLTPRLNGRLYFEKPILTFWLIAASYHVLGHNELALRLPSAVCAMLLVLLTFLFTARVAGERVGLWAAVCLSLCLGTLMIGRTVLTDMPLTLFTTAALFALFEAAHHPDKKSSRRWYVLAFAALGLAFLTKGPVALAVCLGAAGAYLLANRSLIRTMKQVPWLWGLLAFVLIAGPWYVTSLLVHGEKFWRGFFVGQNVARLTSSVLGMGASFLLYVPVMVVFFFPWIGLAVPGLAAGLRPGRRNIRRGDPNQDLDFLCAWWVIVVLAVFSLAQTKLPNYIFPMFPALAVLAGRTIVRLQDGAAGKWTKIGAGLIVAPLGLLLSALFGAMPWILPRLAAKAKPRFDASEYAFLARDLPDMTWIWPALAAVLLVVMVLFGLALLRADKRWTWPATAMAVLVFFAVVFGPLQATMLEYLQAPAKRTALLVKRLAQPGDRVATYALWKPTLFFYLDRPE
ncbi:MAG: glycosyltransferase family 39 protein, partial [Proteobacteria bacterium]|nr:glycosyltransferase family 39 protein [Pseudomonadota bacterium]